MSRVLRLVSVAVVVASSGLTAAQSPTLPSQVPTQPPTTTIPGPGQPQPSAAPAATLADATQTIPEVFEEIRKSINLPEKPRPLNSTTLSSEAAG